MKHGLVLGVGLVLLRVTAGPLLAAGTSEVRSLTGDLAHDYQQANEK